MWAGFIGSKIVKADDSGELLGSPNVYVGPAPVTDENTDLADATNDAAPSVPAPLVRKSMPTAHDLAGKFTTPDKDTGIGHRGKNYYDHLGNKKNSAANNAPPNAGAF